MRRGAFELPDTAAWRHVVDVLSRGGSAAAVVAAAVAAAEPPLSRVHHDPMVVAAFEIFLDAVSRAAKESSRSRAKGSRMALVASVAEALDARADALGRSDAGELAQLAVLDVLLAEGDAREVLVRFVVRWLSAFLARELPNHVGEGERFASLEAHARFRDELAAHVRTAAAALPLEADAAFLARDALAALEARLREAHA